jgi:hypothetical protein
VFGEKKGMPLPSLSSDMQADLAYDFDHDFAWKEEMEHLSEPYLTDEIAPIVDVTSTNSDSNKSFRRPVAL